MSHSAWERLYLAVDGLASGNMDIVSRLENVYVSHLLPLRIEEFKSERAKILFENIKKPVNEGRLKGGRFVLMPLEEARSIAKDIVSLLIQIDHFNDSDI